MQPEVAYADWNGSRICYAVMGSGPHDVVLAGSIVSHIDLLLGHPSVRAWTHEITRFARLVMFDKVGAGLSDPIAKLLTLEDRVSELETVIQAAALERPVIVGVSEGATTAIAYAALRPAALTSLVLASPFVGRGMQRSTDPLTDPHAYLRDYFDDAPPEFRPDAKQLERFADIFVKMQTRWGDGAALEALVPSFGSRTQLALLERSVASPAMIRASTASVSDIDALGLAGEVRVPTLIIHARHDAIPYQCSRELASRIPGSRLVEIDGSDHAPWINNEGRAEWQREFETFVTGHATGPVTDRTLATVVFTDIVDSTKHAATLGDHRWRAVLDTYRGEATRNIEHHRATLVKDLGDGVLVTVPSPLSAIRFAKDMNTAVRGLGIEIRAAIHTGEIEVVDNDIAGLAVHVASRILGEAGPSEILTSRTVRDLVLGSDVGFVSLGDRALRGIPDTWELMKVTDGTAPSSIDTKRHSRWFDRPLLAIASRRSRRSK